MMTSCESSRQNMLHDYNFFRLRDTYFPSARRMIERECLHATFIRSAYGRAEFEAEEMVALERNRYYITLQSGTTVAEIRDVKGDSTYDFEIEATEVEAGMLRDLFNHCVHGDARAYLVERHAGSGQRRVRRQPARDLPHDLPAGHAENPERSRTDGIGGEAGVGQGRAAAAVARPFHNFPHSLDNRATLFA